MENNREYKLNYPHGTFYDPIKKIAEQYPTVTAYEFMGNKRTYAQFTDEIERCSRALVALGVKEDDVVAVSLPNTPHAIIMLYAITNIGAIANMIHPLSSKGEMLVFLNRVEAKVVLCLDQFYEVIGSIIDKTKIEHVIVASITDFLPTYLKLPYKLKEGKNIPKIPEDYRNTTWKKFMKLASGVHRMPQVSDRTFKTGLILQSGGTTGLSKGVCISNFSVTASAMQVLEEYPDKKPGEKMLSVMPFFHGTGLVVGIHLILLFGGTCILIPRFTPTSFAEDLLKHKCNYIIGVPSLYDRVIQEKCLQNADLSFIKAAVTGADFMKEEIENKVNDFFASHNSNVRVRQGYGMTEVLVTCSLTPLNSTKHGTIGVPLSDVRMKIVEPGTDTELPCGEVGEIAISTPANMLGYYKNQDETEIVLRKHEDGYEYVHSGDLGYMDEEGYFFFKGRIKRMIVTNGYNVYPLELEELIEQNELVNNCCVVGVPDPVRVEKVKAFIVLKQGIEKTQETKDRLNSYFRTVIARYAVPREIEFVDDIPKTKIGKADFRKLSDQNQ